MITIGNHCQITEDVKIFTHGGAHVLRKYDPEYDVFGKVCIGDWVYVGNRAMIMPGVTIGDNVLIAAGSVVTKSVPSGFVVGGNPARIICSVDDFRKKNEKYNQRCKSYTQFAKKELLENLDADSFIEKASLTIQV